MPPSNLGGYPPGALSGMPGERSSQSQSARPTQFPPPYAAGYPPGYVASAPRYVQDNPGAWHRAQAPVRKSHVRLVITLVVLAVVLLGGTGAGVLWLSGSHNLPLWGASPTSEPSATHSTGQATPGTTGDTVIYQNPLTAVTPDWNSGPHCFFGSGGYHVKDGYECFAPLDNVTDVTVSVSVQQVTGAATYPYGIVLRDNANDDRYEFDIDSSGVWVFLRYVSANQQYDRIIDTTQSDAIKSGLNTTNTLKVSVTGSHFVFYVNGTKVGEVDDGGLGAGKVGFVGSDGIDVVFSDLVLSRPTGTA